jgi:hypothetical protein
MPLIEDEPPQPLAPRPPELAPVQVRLRLGPEAPVERVLGGDQHADAGRHGDHHRLVLAAGLDQQDLRLAVFGQPVGQHAPAEPAPMMM